ncbi:MAG: AmmeMemoRadiSam system protein A [Candidatus Parcubacteria bacterium]|nr:AmmeMemoRadiSam system protein A [Candidatus Parcubacteria bacterium]
MDPYIKLAKETIKHYLLTKKTIEVPEDLPAEMLNKRAGVFICFKNKGELRGCIGTFLPVYENIADEIIQNTISAATRDHRFLPVHVSELKDLKITIDILAEPVRIEDEEINQLNAKKFGVVVKSEDGLRTGLLLPDLEGVDTVEDQISIASQKAGIDPLVENFHVYKFTVKRHEE